MFTFAPRLIGFVSVMLIIAFCILAALGITAATAAEVITMLIKLCVGITTGTAVIMLLLASRDHTMQRSLRRLLVLSLCFGFVALAIWPTDLNPAHSVPYLVTGAAVTAFLAMLVTPRADMSAALEGRYVLCMGIPLVATVLAWKIGLGPLWDAHPVLGGLAAFSLTTIALGLVYGLQEKALSVPVRQLTV